MKVNITLPEHGSLCAQLCQGEASDARLHKEYGERGAQLNVLWFRSDRNVTARLRHAWPRPAAAPANHCIEPVSRDYEPGL